jgi:hypothetical protein
MLVGILARLPVEEREGGHIEDVADLLQFTESLEDGRIRHPETE